MKKVICVLLSVVLCVTMMLSGTVLASGAAAEYIQTDKTEYKSGEIFKVSFQFDSAENNRYICIYKDSADTYNNMKYIVSATGLSGWAYAPANIGWTWHGGGPTIVKANLAAGTYIMKVMYLNAGAASTSAPDYVEGGKSNLTYTFTVVANDKTTPAISATDTEVEVGDTLNINYEGATSTLGTDTLKVELQNSAGTAVKIWDIWDGGGVYLGIAGTLSYDTADLEVGTYKAKLITTSTSVTMGNSEVEFNVKAPTPVVGTIATDKAEYKSGEMIKVSYDFDIAESNRYICIYKDEVDYNKLMFVMGATVLSHEGVWAPVNIGWTWHGGGPDIITRPLQPGNYIMKVMYLNAGAATTSAPDYVTGSKSKITATFTVVANTGSDVPVISATKTDLEAGEDLQIAFDGVTNKLGTKTLKVELKNGAGTTVKTWDLWNGSTQYAGLNGMVSYTDDLAAGTYTASLICSDAEFALGNKQIQFTVKAQSNPLLPTPTTPPNTPNTPTGDATIWVISILFMIGVGTYMVVKKRCTR